MWVVNSPFDWTTLFLIWITITIYAASRCSNKTNFALTLSYIHITFHLYSTNIFTGIKYLNNRITCVSTFKKRGKFCYLFISFVYLLACKRLIDANLEHMRIVRWHILLSYFVDAWRYNKHHRLCFLIKIVRRKTLLPYCPENSKTIFQDHLLSLHLIQNLSHATTISYFNCLFPNLPTTFHERRYFMGISLFYCYLLLLKVIKFIQIGRFRHRI